MEITPSTPKKKPPKLINNKNLTVLKAGFVSTKGKQRNNVCQENCLSFQVIFIPFRLHLCVHICCFNQTLNHSRQLLIYQNLFFSRKNWDLWLLCSPGLDFLDMSDPSELDQTTFKFQQQSLDADPLSPPSLGLCTPIIHICIRSTLQVICWFIVLELQTNGIIFPLALPGEFSTDFQALSGYLTDTSAWFEPFEISLCSHFCSSALLQELKSLQEPRHLC